MPPSSQALPKRQWNNWKGRTASDSTLRLVASVHDELQTMLGASVEEQILSRGQGWSSVSSGDASKGSRLEKIVARLCRCGITTVMQARRLDGRYEKPGQRGVKRAVADSESDDSSNAGTEDEVADLLPDVSQGLEQASLQPTPKMQEVGGVRGRYLPQALLQPQEHAIAITIGRIIIWGTVNAIPNRTLEGLMAQMSLANAALGEKYHGKWFASMFATLASQMCQKMTCSRFSDPPVNLPFPSCFRLVWDGITLKNGATVIPILVVFTDYAGRIVSELVDAPISQGSSGPEVAALVNGVLERKLLINNKVAFRSTRGLSSTQVSSQSAAAGESMSSGCDLLTSMLVDRAYSGNTGNKADEYLCQKLGMKQRVGLADKIHCCTGAAAFVWAGKNVKAKSKAAAKSKGTGGNASNRGSSSSNSSSSSGGSSGGSSSSSSCSSSHSSRNSSSSNISRCSRNKSSSGSSNSSSKSRSCG